MYDRHDTPPLAPIIRLEAFTANAVEASDERAILLAVLGRAKAASDDVRANQVIVKNALKIIRAHLARIKVTAAAGALAAVPV